MNRRTKIQFPDGEEHDAVELSFQTSGENWNEYLLDDGSVVRVKLVMTSIARVEGVYDQNGSPIYVAQSTNVMSVSAPEDLRRKDAGS
jgi:hypothetical protein